METMSGIEVDTWRRRLPLPHVVAGVNEVLDRLARPTVRIADRTTSVFRLCGYTGFGVAIVVSQAVTATSGLSATVMVILTGTAAMTFLALVMLVKLVTGEETIVYYHHELAVLLTSVLVLLTLDLPVLGYLDAVVLGIGGFLACGRIGCLLVGCCHGRPARIGVRYRAEHADHGFTPGYVGVRVLPIQLLESVGVGGIVTLGIAQVVAGAPPGRALTWWVVTYGAMRSWLEFLRGDPGRPYLLGLSQAQRIATVLVVATTGSVWAGLLPGVLGVCIPAMALTLAAGITGWRRWRADAASVDVLGPFHLAEVAEMAQALAAVPAQLHVFGPSSLGVTLSATARSTDDATERHYAMSALHGGLTPVAASRLARHALQVCHPDVPGAALVEGRTGVHHVVVAGTAPSSGRSSSVTPGR